MGMKRSILILAALLSGLCLRAQNVVDLRLTEIMAEPDSTSLVDDFGAREGWIEILNTSQGTVNLAGCFLTDDRNNLKKSMIPKGDLRTQLGQRQVIVFYASGNGNQGTFYTSFKIRKGATIYLVSNDGRTIVDSLQVPANLPAGKSVEKLPADRKSLVWETADEFVVPSPMVLNGGSNAETAAQRMARTDPHGFILTVTAVSVVFTALAILWLLFWLFFERPAKRKAAPAKAKAPVKGNASGEIAAAIAMALDMENGGDVYAAIATAMHLYLSESVHDNESFIVTIKSSDGSAWNIKSRNFRKLPR